MGNDSIQMGSSNPTRSAKLVRHDDAGPRAYKQSPDDFSYEGDITDLEPLGAPWSVDADDAAAGAVDVSDVSNETIDDHGNDALEGDEAYVTVDNPDDFE
ncbi:hypothetical protein [Alicyclobacillus ferrooxydans]|uniref:Uncharacterized protein n=1 Tax=Alicyclobacillus ferrooxydans TaxID=471514 RepID=A0A0P9GPN8_9BACL|nr:hypothetical protein [Alicyclobacillus ferrooxydans]KPV42636.1 hypothetical protein AN477_16840 [Alicyclobacillus ferrooxydans]